MTTNAPEVRPRRRSKLKTTVLLLTLAILAADKSVRTEGGVIHVTTTAQGVFDDGQCSLQEAIWAANLDRGEAPNSFSPLAFFSTGCEAGSGADVIELQPSATYNMTGPVDDSFNPFGPTANPIVLTAITIEAHGASLVRPNPGLDFAGVNFRAFAVSLITSPLPGICFGTLIGSPVLDLSVCGADYANELGIGPSQGNLTIRNAHIKGFTAKGGNGTDGGGGGLGAGGAIYVAYGRLTVENSTFVHNGAGGGNGSFNDSWAGGGGGGLSGNGGTAFQGGGGGGGGARGDGGDGHSTCGTPCLGLGAGGGGGGGTVADGEDGIATDVINGGYRCGGNGGYATLNPLDSPKDGGHGICAGGGGGGGRDSLFVFAEVNGGHGGDGHYGGGGGGGSYLLTMGDAGDGGFGGGGGAAHKFGSNILGFGPDGGDGGFGGGGGAGIGGYISRDFPFNGGPGKGGSFAGSADAEHGGGAAALGGAIFGDGAAIIIRNSTFFANYVLRGLSGGGDANSGRGVGGAIFAVDGTLEVLNSTLFKNETTTNGGGLAMYRSSRSGFSASLTLLNSIIAQNTSQPGKGECYFLNSVNVVASGGNLITNNDTASLQETFDGSPYQNPHECPGVATKVDPQLVEPLQITQPGNTPTLAITANSSAFNGGVAPCEQFDQRGVLRAFFPPCDIGAFELVTEADVRVTKTLASPVVAGGDVSYTIAASNAGPIDANAVILTDAIPANATFRSLTAAAGWTCTTPAVGGTGTITCNKSTALTVGATQTFTLVVRLPASLADGTQLCNTANISSTTPDPEGTNNSATACGTVVTRADLRLSQSVSTTGKAGKGTATFVLVVRNDGPSDSQNVALVASSSLFIGPPPGAITASPGVTCTVAGPTVTCAWSRLAAGAQDTVRIEVPWKSAVGQVCDSVNVTAGTIDPNAINNTSSACIGKR